MPKPGPSCVDGGGAPSTPKKGPSFGKGLRSSAASGVGSLPPVPGSPRQPVKGRPASAGSPLASGQSVPNGAAPFALLASSLDPPRGKPGNRRVRVPLPCLRGLALSTAVVSSAVPRESSFPSRFAVWFPPVEPGGFRSAWLRNLPVTAPIRLAAQRAPYPRCPPSGRSSVLMAGPMSVPRVRFSRTPPRALGVRVGDAHPGARGMRAERSWVRSRFPAVPNRCNKVGSEIQSRR